MNSWWIHPRYLAAHAVAALGDADLRDGVHLRLLPSRALGLALSPMPVWTLPPQPLDPLPGMAWFDRHGRPWTSGVLDDAGGEAIGWFNGNLPQGLRLLAVEAAFAAGDGDIALLDRIDQRCWAIARAHHTSWPHRPSPWCGCAGVGRCSCAAGSSTRCRRWSKRLAAHRCCG